MSDEALILFLKAPIPGTCKTRLCPPLSPEQAAALYRAFCADIWSALPSGPDRWIAYQPGPNFPTPDWLASGASFFPQEGPTLGHRLIHAFERLFARGYVRVAAMGTDAPTLPAERLTAAFRALREKEAVFGPAMDGGYYLVGLNRMRRDLFENIPWSTEEVLSRTKEVLTRTKTTAAFLPGHYDVDSAADLKRLSRELEGPAARRCPETKKRVALLRDALPQLAPPTKP